MVEVARKTSIITTTLLLRSYKCNRAGEMEVFKVGLLLIIQAAKVREIGERVGKGSLDLDRVLLLTY